MSKTDRSYLRRCLVAAALGAVLVTPLAIASAATAWADPAPGAGRVVVGSVRDVGGVSPYVGVTCNTATPYYTQPGGKEGEPYIAVDPSNPQRRIVVWMDATRATVDVKYTTNAGRSWHTSVPGGIDGCTGETSQPWEASGDPWLSFGPDGVAYLSTLTWAHFVTPPASEYVSVVHVQTSRDGGRTWSKPVPIAGTNPVADKPMVLADPYRRGVAYEIWRNQSFGLPVGARGATALLFAKTTDAGRTWSSPIRIAAGSDTDFFGSPQLSVLRNGTLVATSSLSDPTSGTDLLSYRSTNHGRTWSNATLIRVAPAGGLAPICGQGVAGADSGSSAGQQTVVNGRTVLLVVLDGTSAAAGRGALVESWSRDGGLSWRSRQVLAVERPILLASVTAGRGGSLGLIWDEINTAAVDCASAAIPTRTRFATTEGAGALAAGTVTVGAPWWNLAGGARGTGGFSGYFIGDYQALAATATGFTSITVAGNTLGRGHLPWVTGATGVMVAAIHTTD